MTKIQHLREKLKRGFYIDNLNDMTRICRDMALESTNPAPFFILQKIFAGIADYWDGGPVEVDEAKIVENELFSSIVDLINAIEAGVSVEEIMLNANKAISSYLFLFSSK